MQHASPGSGGLFPVTAGRHFSNVFALMLHKGMLVGSSIKTRATKTITRAATMVLVLFSSILSLIFLSLDSSTLPWNP